VTAIQTAKSAVQRVVGREVIFMKKSSGIIHMK
jgi:hypothetical protein